MGHQADCLLTRYRGFYANYFPPLIVLDPTSRPRKVRVRLSRGEGRRCYCFRAASGLSSSARFLRLVNRVFTASSFSAAALALSPSFS